MGVSKKGKRKIICLNRDFYWYVTLDWEDAGQVKLHIISEDKQFIAAYNVGQSSQPDSAPFIVIQGKQFEGIVMENGCYKRILTPVWEDDTVITPDIVARIIVWCFSVKEVVTLAD